MLLGEMGMEPGAELRELQRRILDDGDLQRSPTARSALAKAAGVHLPTHLSPLIGREMNVEKLTTLVGSSPLVTIVGAPGCGKTRLAVDVAGRQAPTSRTASGSLI